MIKQKGWNQPAGAQTPTGAKRPGEGSQGPPGVWLGTIPGKLKALDQWVVHKKKVPFNPRTGEPAKAGQPETWGSYREAVAALTEHPDRYDGLGFEFHEGGIVGVDLDSVRDPATGQVDPEARKIIEELSSYTEISPSGYGFHILLESGAEPDWNRVRLPRGSVRRPETDPATGLPRQDPKTGEMILKTPELEIYNRGRYFTVTGDVFHGYHWLERRDGELAALLRAHRPRKADPSRPTNNKGGGEEKSPRDYLQIGLDKDKKFRDLWEGERPLGNESADDLALMNRLAYWCNCDPEAMTEAFLRSPHAQQKDPRHWKKAAERRDYLERTALKAVLDCASTAEDRDRRYRSGSTEARSLRQNLKFMEVFEPQKTFPELLDYDLNDIGNAERLLFLYSDSVRYSRELMSWFIWNGKIWEQDLTGKIYRYGILTAKTYRFTAAHHHKVLRREAETHRQNPDAWRESRGDDQPPDPKGAQSVLGHAVRSGGASRIRAMIETAGHAAYIRVDQLDGPQTQNLMTCQNGVVDLRTGALLPHDPGRLLTRMTGEPYSPEAKAPLFRAFLEQIFPDDPALLRYIQKVLGYCVTGETREQCFFIGYGTGANGKSTLLDAVSAVADSFIQTIPTGVLMDRDRESSATPELARAKGARLVIASESKDLSSLNEAQIKQLTGGDRISARPLYSQGFEFKPNFKIWLSTNHKPHIKGSDNGIWRRVHLIPFRVTIPEEAQDPALPDKLRAERAGIFAWLVEGARLYYREGLQKPEAVRLATESYRSEMDLIGGFLADCTVARPGSFVRSTSLYAAYQAWCAAGGIDSVKQNTFGRRLGERGIIARRTAIARGYMDIALTETGGSYAASVPEEIPPLHHA